MTGMPMRLGQWCSTLKSVFRQTLESQQSLISRASLIEELGYASFWMAIAVVKPPYEVIIMFGMFTHGLPAFEVENSMCKGRGSFRNRISTICLWHVCTAEGWKFAPHLAHFRL